MTKHRSVFVAGIFNVLHPGHIRLLKFAKECGDKLIVGVISDTLAGDGAHVAQDFRLEAVKMNALVDEVFLVQTSVEQEVLRLKPDIVVKGKEHESQKNPEQKAVESYGGKLIFSSGDVVFSSLDLIRREIGTQNSKPITLPESIYVTAKSFI